jgi:hypothetical protein
MDITSPGSIFISLYAAFDAESGALATAGGDATAGPIYWADPVSLARLRAPAARKKQRIPTFNGTFIFSPQFLLAVRENYFL